MTMLVPAYRMIEQTAAPADLTRASYGDVLTAD